MSERSLCQPVPRAQELPGPSSVVAVTLPTLGFNDMTADRADYHNIPGTTVFDAQRSRQGYWLNQFCMSLMKADNRAAFKADESGYLDRFAMTADQKRAILDRDWNRMIELGGNIYFTAKLGATDGLSFQQMAAMMTGMTQQQYADMMLHGGRSPEGNRFTSEWEGRAHG
jgi:protocatechuate 4,5-dioxygenase, alpha chain